MVVEPDLGTQYGRALCDMAYPSVKDGKKFFDRKIYANCFKDVSQNLDYCEGNGKFRQWN
jgi:hypothetical protein